MHQRKSLFASLVQITEFVLVQTHLVQYRRMNVAKMVALLDRAQANRIGGTNGLPTLNTPASHPHTETHIVVIAPLATLCFRRSPKLSTPQD
mgnify:CR=1 FL=1